MVYTRYGKIFRELRTQKGLSLSYFEKLGFDKSNIARFERGETMISLEKIDMMLQSMDISLSEYELILNYFVPDFQEQFLLDIEKAEFNLDCDRLRKLYEEVKGSHYRLLSLAAKARVLGLQNSEIREVMVYLQKAKQWGYFELCLTYSVLEYLDTKDLKQLLEDFDLKNRPYYTVTKYRRKMYQIAYRAIFVLGSRGEEKLIGEILQMTDSSKQNTDFYLSVFRKLIYGFTECCFRQKEEGLKQINHALNLFEELGSKELRVYIEQRVNLFLRNYRIKTW